VSDLETYGDTLDEDCPRCDARAGSRCVNPETGHIAKAPCLARMVGREVPVAAKTRRRVGG
jgi:hypothetical protein